MQVLREYGNYTSPFSLIVWMLELLGLHETQQCLCGQAKYALYANSFLIFILTSVLRNRF